MGFQFSIISCTVWSHYLVRDSLRQNSQMDERIESNTNVTYTVFMRFLQSTCLRTMKMLHICICMPLSRDSFNSEVTEIGLSTLVVWNLYDTTNEGNPSSSKRSRMLKSTLTVPCTLRVGGSQNTRNMNPLFKKCESGFSVQKNVFVRVFPYLLEIYEIIQCKYVYKNAFRAIHLMYSLHLCWYLRGRLTLQVKSWQVLMLALNKTAVGALTLQAAISSACLSFWKWPQNSYLCVDLHNKSDI